ncbi:CFEM domain-containing protein [Plectosphaerella plurivora]|uniref:CFEM domain-containing protein n=1 Tax=Plectosphaerella plurivora TaxID=936078 RepID=A0A9P8V0V9_9PEZI|nr:CFEM domain-containing protein [Plectosphaerella plurivora]
MRTNVLSILVWVVAGLVPALAQGSTEDALALLPSCASTCLITAVLESACSPTNQTCVCTDAPLQKAVETCVLTTCTPKQALTTMNITSSTCGAPIRNRSREFNAISISLGTITNLIVVIRIAYQHFSSAGSLGWDDLFIVITLCTGLPGTVINSVGLAPNGLGQDVWRVPFDILTTFIRWFYVQEILYFSQIAFLKTSILLFYKRIFGHTQINMFIVGTLAFNALYGLVFVFLAAFQCRPISYYWTNWDHEHTGTCLNINAIAWANAAVSIALDLWMLALPLSQIRSLNLHWKKKVGVAMMFCVGTFVTVVSILRLQSLVAFATSHNPTWDQYAVANWSTIEINVGIICACMPAMRLVLVRIFPRILGSTKQYPSYPGGHSGGHYNRSNDPHKLGGSRKLGSESVVRTANKEERPLPPVPLSSGKRGRGIILTRDVTIDYHDETSLVQLRDVERLSMKDGSSRGSTPVTLE